MVRILTVSVVLGALLTGIGQVLPPLHVPAHEWSQLFAVAVALVVWELVRRHALEKDPDDAVLYGLAGVVAAGVISWAGMVLANQWHGCRLDDAAVFFWVTLLPLGAFGVVIGAMLGELEAGWKARAGVLAGVVAVCVVHDVGQFVLGVHGQDPLLGQLLLADQRALMARLPVPYLLHRAWLLLAVAGAWTSFRAWRERGDWRLAGGLAGLAWTSAALAGPKIGLGWSGDRVQYVLDQTYTSERFVIRYASGGIGERWAPIVGREAEYQLDLLVDLFDAEPVECCLELRLFNDTEALYQATGFRSAHAHIDSVDMLVDDLFDHTFPHELAHIVDPGLGYFVVNRGFTEGAAMLWSDGYVDDPGAHTELAAAQRIGRLPSAVDVFSILGFWTLDEGLAYDAAGSFLGYLGFTYGEEKLATAVSERSFAVYGRPLIELDAEWQAFLTDLDVELDETNRARDRFDPLRAPAFTSRTCPKLDKVVLDPWERADRLLNSNAAVEALAVYEELAAAEPEKVRWTWAVVSAQQRAGRHADAIATLEAMKTDAPDQELRRVQGIINSSVAVKDYGRLYAMFDARRELEPPKEDRRRVERLLRDPALRDSLASILSPDVPYWVRGARLRALAEDHPDRADLHLLAWTRGGFRLPNRRWTEPNPFTMDELDAFVEGVRVAPDLCPLVARDLLRAADGLLHRDRVDEASDVLQVLATCDLPRRGWQVRRRTARIDALRK